MKLKYRFVIAMMELGHNGQWNRTIKIGTQINSILYVKIGFSIIRKAETSNLAVGANVITLKKPSIDMYEVIGLVGAIVDTAQNILVKGFDGASGYVAIQNNSTADSHTISGSWLIQRKP